MLKIICCDAGDKTFIGEIKESFTGVDDGLNYVHLIANAQGVRSIEHLWS
jgi:hypothetical protein